MTAPGSHAPGAATPAAPARPLRIAFLFADYSAKNAIYDYSRLLAAACRRRGHACALFGMLDRSGSGWLADEDVPRAVVPAGLPWRDRVRLVRRHLSEFQPDVISLQFVCYAWNPRGVIFDQILPIARAVRGWPVHLYFHELWIGLADEATPKERLVGFLQGLAVRALLQVVRPRVIQANSSVYVALLRELGWPATRLPLFGTVPPVGTKADPWLLPLLREKGLPIDAASRGDFWLLGMIGNLPAIWPSEPLVSLVREAGRLHGRRPVLLLAGRTPPAGVALWESLARRYGDDPPLIRLGELSAERLSQYLLALDAGLTMTPWLLAEKSSAISTMLDHGLPVIVNRDELRFDAFPPDRFVPEEGLVRLDPALVDLLPSLPKRPPRPDSVEHTAEAFLRSLALSSTPPDAAIPG